MKSFLPFIYKKQTLKRKLVGYMFLLAVLLLLLFLVGMFLIGGYTGTKRKLADTLNFQADVFQRQVELHYSNLAVMGIQLSELTTENIDGYLEDHQLNFSDLNGSQAYIDEIQEMLIDPLHQKLMETDCTGAFILLNTQINSKIENADVSRSGLYLQRNSLDSTDTRILLYRGPAQIGKRHDAMPHRKWRLEFNTNEFPNYDSIVSTATQPLANSYRLSDVITLPGTSERVQLLTVPILGQNGSFYGICGLEISESYFKHIFAQPSELTHAIFCLSNGSYGMTNAAKSLSAGIVNDYYLAPSGQFQSKPFGSGLFTCESEDERYIGLIRSVRLCPGQDAYSLSTLIPRADYDEIAQQDIAKIVMLVAVFVAFATACCFYFSRQYLRPLKQSLEQIHQKEYADSQSRIIEIDDLFDFLAEQDRLREEALAAVQLEKNSAQAELAVAQLEKNSAKAELAATQLEKDSVEAELAQIRSELSQDKQELQRLAYSRKTEVDPDDYANFRRGIQVLTATERRVFDYYLEGRSVKEITELMSIKESTVRFHNRNIYTALGVKSLKQLLRCAAIMKQEEESDMTQQH